MRQKLSKIKDRSARKLMKALIRSFAQSVTEAGAMDARQAYSATLELWETGSLRFTTDEEKETFGAEFFDGEQWHPASMPTPNMGGMLQ
jgi:hypothetical protein